MIRVHLKDGRTLHHDIVGKFGAGKVIDEEALAELLSGEKIAGAGLDVFEREPAVNKELLKAPCRALKNHLMLTVSMQFHENG